MARKQNDGGWIAILIIVAVLWAVIKFIGEYWQILLALSAVGLFVYIIFSAGGKSGGSYQDARDTIYEVKETPPQLPPMPYSNETADAARLINIFIESMNLVETSANIETVNDRYGDCLRFGAKLAAIPLADFDVYRKELERLQRPEQKINLFDAAIDRYLGKQIAELENLQRAAAKEKRVEKILATLNRLEYMPEASKNYARKILTARTSSGRAVVPSGGDLEQALNAIPPEVIQLLWFGDGRRKNYSATLPTFTAKFFSITFPREEEPSLIRTTDFLGVSVTPAPKLDYYPSYATMTPNARATYLNWLRNIDTEIEIGYVFIFYYGLERRLLAGSVDEFNRAFEMIRRLRAHHVNNSFDAYSSTALVAACLIRNRPDVLNRLLLEEINLSPTLLACLAHFKSSLNAGALMKLAGAVGFTNKRYIKNYPDKFRDALTELLAEKFSEHGYPLTEKILAESPQRSEIFFANVSLKREGIIPDVARSESFRRDVSELLSAAHERVKFLLKEERKQKKPSTWEGKG